MSRDSAQPWPPPASADTRAPTARPPQLCPDLGRAPATTHTPPGDAQQASSNRAAPQAPAPHPTSPAAPIAERQAPRTTRQARDPAFAEASTTSSSTVRPLRSKNEQRPVLSANRLPSRQPRFGIQRRWPRAQRARITRWKRALVASRRRSTALSSRAANCRREAAPERRSRARTQRAAATCPPGRGRRYRGGRRGAEPPLQRGSPRLAASSISSQASVVAIGIALVVDDPASPFVALR